jgi:lysophospholipase L1-like esterase
MITARRRRTALATGVFLLLAGCSSSPSPPPAGNTRAGSTPATGAPSSSGASSRGLYVSIGDSYAAGYQPTSSGRGHTTRNGFAYQVVSAAEAKRYDLALTNFGCAGATTTSVLRSTGCDRRDLGPGAPPYDGKTQAAAAEQFLRAHRGQVDLVTVSIGGNDVTACGVAANPVACLAPAIDTLKVNLARLLAGLRAAAGPSTRIVGLTYPDVLLGSELSTDPAVKNLANLSVLAFQTLINPALKAAYEAVHGTFVDVTAATGAYGPLTATTVVPPYGRIPVPVARICTLTYYCQYRDIHPRTVGYALISKLVVAALPPR